MRFKILNGFTDTCCRNALVFASTDKTRGSKRKLFMFGSVDNRDANFFPKHIVPVWNELPDSVVQAISVAGFKRSLNSLDLSKFCV